MKMMRVIPIKGKHNFVKKNLMTLKDRKGHYDDMVCSKCDLKAKRRGFVDVEIDGRTSDDQVFNCITDNKKIRKIRITNCYARGAQFGNLTPNSQHEVVTLPDGYKNDAKGVWVMGVGEPVKVLHDEFIEVS